MCHLYKILFFFEPPSCLPRNGTDTSRKVFRCRCYIKTLINTLCSKRGIQIFKVLNIQKCATSANFIFLTLISFVRKWDRY